jgi:hypothetical protein
MKQDRESERNQIGTQAQDKASVDARLLIHAIFDLARTIEDASQLTSDSLSDINKTLNKILLNNPGGIGAGR